MLSGAEEAILSMGGQRQRLVCWQQCDHIPPRFFSRGTYQLQSTASMDKHVPMYLSEIAHVAVYCGGSFCLLST